MLILARFVTGVSAGFLTPASLSIITTSFAPGEVRNRALLVYGGIGAGGFTLGMVAGRLLDDGAGWRWVFFAPVLFASRCCWSWPTASSPRAPPSRSGAAAASTPPGPDDDQRHAADRARRWSGRRTSAGR